MCTHITMDVQCTNIHNGVYTYHYGITIYKHTQWCVHISQWIYNAQTYTMLCTHITMNVQTYTMMCTHITMDLQCTNIHNDVYTYHNGFTMYKHTQLCAHILQ